MAPSRSRSPSILTITLSLALSDSTCHAFLQLRHPQSSFSPRFLSLKSNSPNFPPDSPPTVQEDAALQWELFTRHHAVVGEWWGTWTTYDYMGNVLDSTTAAVSLQPSGEQQVTHTHLILSSSSQSDCDTCFDSSQLTTIPIATYTPSNLHRRHRCAAIAMVVGPSLLPSSGTISTELTLRHGNARLRVTFQHAPVWKQGVQPHTCPPQALKFLRATVSRERLSSTNDTNPMTAAKEETPFSRSVPPYQWHAKWAGTAWTWGPNSGDRGWYIQEMDEADSWQGRPVGDVSHIWSLRLPGGILIQCPRVIVEGVVGLCRLAWLPEGDGEDGAKLLRVEAGVWALEPVEEDQVMGFYPPSLASLRCDVLEKVGELEGASLLEREERAEGFTSWNSEDERIREIEEKTSTVPVVLPLIDKIDLDPRNALDL